MQINPWNFVFLIGFIVYVTIRGVFKQRVKSNEMMVRRVDGVEKALMLIVIPGGLLLPVIYLFTPLLGFADYHLPVHADVPHIEAVFVDKPDPILNPIGAKGMGEIALIGFAAAVANAVYHATGKRIRELPITPDKLMQSLM